MATLPADLIIHTANVLAIDPLFTRAQGLAIRDNKIVAVGSNREIQKLAGPNTQALDAKGATIMPGLCDSHMHSFRAAVSEFSGSAPSLTSLSAAFAHIRQKAANQAPGTWIILERVYPTRMTEGRLPTKAELDTAAPGNPVYWNCGPVSMANSKALEASGITATTPNPVPGEIVKDPKRGNPPACCGMPRNCSR